MIRRRRLAAAGSVVAALVVVASVLGPILALGSQGGGVHLGTLGGGPGTGTKPVPAGGATGPPTQLASFSFVSPSLGWALGGAPCGGSLCASVLRTSDGGRTWQRVPAPPAYLGACQKQTCVSQIRFANAQDGYIFGPALFVTTDGGQHWHSEPSQSIVALEAAGTNVVRVLSSGAVQSAQPGSTAWQTLPAPNERWAQLVRSDPSTLYLRVAAPGRSGASDLWRSTDEGTTWQPLVDPCAARAYGRVLAMGASGNDLGLVCAPLQIAPQEAGYKQGVTLSSDAGTSFGPLRSLPHLPGPDGGSEPLALALASPSVLAVLDSEGGVQSSFDGGVTWTTTIPQPSGYSVQPGDFPVPVGTGAIGFETSTEGHVITPASTIWTTTDGGRRWTPYRVAPAPASAQHG
jgi:photosystem II stability/assembly factor-like uncharacterized protein